MLRPIHCVGTMQSFDLYSKLYIKLPLHLIALLTACYYRNHVSLIDTALPVTSVGLTAVLLKTTESSGMWCYVTKQAVLNVSNITVPSTCRLSCPKLLDPEGKSTRILRNDRHYPPTDTVSHLSRHDRHFCTAPTRLKLRSQTRETDWCSASTADSTCVGHTAVDDGLCF
jgi:hypothetical protein